jgi:hypothetical protein
MCLFNTTTDKSKLLPDGIYYRVFHEVSPGKYHSLFHIPLWRSIFNLPYRLNKKYWSFKPGFHVFVSKDAADYYCDPVGFEKVKRVKCEDCLSVGLECGRCAGTFKYMTILDD